MAATASRTARRTTTTTRAQMGGEERRGSSRIALSRSLRTPCSGTRTPAPISGRSSRLTTTPPRRTLARTRTCRPCPRLPRWPPLPPPLPFSPGRTGPRALGRRLRITAESASCAPDGR
ncbi:unnamed protein product, partial [Ectocarpus sp. 8 AP-2014]